MGKQKEEFAIIIDDNDTEATALKATFKIDQNTPETMKLDIFETDPGTVRPFKTRTIPHGHKVLDIRTLLEKSQWIPLDDSRSGEIFLAAKFFPTAKAQQSKQTSQDQQKLCIIQENPCQQY